MDDIPTFYLLAGCLYISNFRGNTLMHKYLKNFKEEILLNYRTIYSIYISNCNCEKITIRFSLFKNLKELSIENCKLKIFPKIDICHKLKNINFSSNNLTKIEAKFPKKLECIDFSNNELEDLIITHIENVPLKNLNLSNNKLINIPNCIYTLIKTLTLNCIIILDNNNFWFENPNVDYTIDYLNQKCDEILPVDIRKADFLEIITNLNLTKLYDHLLNNNIHINLDFDFFEEKEYAEQTIRFVNLTTDDSENVHLSSIQKNILNCVNFLMDSKSTIPYNKDYLILLQDEYEHSNQICNLLDIFNNYTEIHILSECKLSDILERVYVFIKLQNVNSQKELFNILGTEIIETKELCFTGKFSRLINVLSGFVPQINIGISEQEELNDRIIVLIKNKNQNKNVENDNLKNEVLELLIEYNIPEFNWSEYLDYL
jgi:hypothetical protein